MSQWRYSVIKQASRKPQCLVNVDYSSTLMLRFYLAICWNIFDHVHCWKYFCLNRLWWYRAHNAKSCINWTTWAAFYMSILVKDVVMREQMEQWVLLILHQSPFPFLWPWLLAAWQSFCLEAFRPLNSWRAAFINVISNPCDTYIHTAKFVCRLVPLVHQV